MKFSDRKKLADQIDLYIRRKNILSGAMGVITALDTFGLLREPTLREDIFIHLRTNVDCLDDEQKLALTDEIINIIRENK